MKTHYVVAAIIAATIAVPALGADVAGLMKTQPVFSTQTNKNMYDLERCMIEVDAPIMPHVYRQPDRPQRTLFVWDGGGGVGGVSAAAQLDGTENTKIAFWGREKILRRIQPCIDLAYSG